MTGGFTLKSWRECTASHRPGYWWTSCLTSSWLPGASTNANLPQINEDMSGSLSYLCWLWMFLELSKKESRMQNTSLIHLSTTKNSPLTGLTNSFVVFLFIGITLTGRFILQSQMHCNNLAPLPTWQAMTPTTCTALPWTNRVLQQCSNHPSGHF